MNKREFLTQGGVLTSTAMAGSWLASATRPQADHPSDAPAPASAQPGTALLRTWEARIGERFEARSSLGRSVPLHLVQAQAQERSHEGVEQFWLSFDGPRHLPLNEGLHELSGANGEPTHLHLQPIRSADGMRYLAHFSLLA